MTNNNVEASVAGMNSPLSMLSIRPALRNRCVLTGQSGFFGKSETKLKPAAQYSSPPKESTIWTSEFRNETVENGEGASHLHPEVPGYYSGTCGHSWILPAGTDQRSGLDGASSTGLRPGSKKTNTAGMEMRSPLQKER